MTNKNQIQILDIDDKQAKQITNSIFSNSANKIIKYLEKNQKATPSNLSEELKIPLSTITNTLNQLQKSNIIEDTHFHYSKKGKQVKHYSLTQKIIIIAPNKNQIFLNQIKDLIGLFFFTIIGTTFINFQSKSSSLSTQALPLIQEIQDESSTQIFAKTAPEITYQEPNLAFYFFIGATSIILILLFLRIFKRFNKP